MFTFNANTQIISSICTKPVESAIHILKRDIMKVFIKSDLAVHNIILQRSSKMHSEAFGIDVKEEITISAGDDLGFVYALLYISEKYLGIKPFWFWMDQQITRTDKIEIDNGYFESPSYVVKFRGWFFNDEVLIIKWKINGDSEEPWRMAFEALLRCGGNMAIPGTDRFARKNRQMASDMGLWITHHHAEPLGAEMFIREYPNISPNFIEHKELFYKLWEKAVIEQKNYKVIWNLCFRGQGDHPFWEADTSRQFDTSEKRGGLISEIIEKQCNIVKKHVKDPVFCTNLYGEIMELYKEGHIKLDPNIIKVKADNGYGKMVTRRRDNHSVRISSMPDENDKGCQGIYYHVSFYDLQAANHITMLPNSIDFVNNELSEVLKKGGRDFWIINCSNVRPHTYSLDAVRKKWLGQMIDDEVHSKEFARDYFCDLMEVAKCYQEYPNAMISYGKNEDEHIGEQFYTENVRIIAHQFLVNKHKGSENLNWITGDTDFREQIRIICHMCRNGESNLADFYKLCNETSERMNGRIRNLFNATIGLHANIHYNCAMGTRLLGDAFEEYFNSNYKKAFILFGKSAECFDSADQAMRDSEYEIWNDFYKNDCFADIKHSAYMIRKVMGIVRELGDNVRHDKWYRDTMYSLEDRNVFLLLVTDNHMTDWELYQAMKEEI